MNHRTRAAAGIIAVLALLLTGCASSPPADTAALQLTAAPAPLGPIPVPQGVRADLPAPLGFAQATRGGEGGTLCRVENALDDPANPTLTGTLRSCLTGATGPRWVVFKRGMTIHLGAALDVPSNITIDGRDRDVTITGGVGIAGLHIYDADNVIVTNLTMHTFGDLAAPPSQNDTNDAINVRRSTRVWLDHLTLSEAADKAIGIDDGGGQITVSSVHFLQQEQTLQIGAQFTAAADAGLTVTVMRSWFDRDGYRLPMTFYARVQVVNNLMELWTVSAVRSARIAQTSLDGNVFRPGIDKHAALTVPAQKCNDNGTLCDDRPGYLRSTGNVIQTTYGPGVINTNEPQLVFDPAEFYDLPVATAGDDLATAIQTDAGAHAPVAP